MKHHIYIVAIIALCVGAGIGYVVAEKKEVPTGMHRMADGTLMSNVQPQSEMRHSMDGMMTGLSGKTGDEFDKAFLEEMIVHHQGALDMANALLQNTKRPELQKLGNDIITAQTGEIQMMQSWLNEWF